MLSRTGRQMATTVSATPCVLILDDDTIAVEYLSSWLGNRGLRILSASCTRVADELLAQHKVDWLLVDRRLPDGDGLEWLHARLHPTQSPRTLVLSGDQINSGDLPEGVKYLRKPVDGERLLQEMGIANVAVASTDAGAAPEQLPDLDDAAALRALAGNPRAVRALRAMLHSQLDAGRDWQDAIGDPVAHTRTLYEIHKLRAGAAMTGCARLAQACGAIEVELRAARTPGKGFIYEFKEALASVLVKLAHS